MPDYPDFKSLFDSGIPEPTEVHHKLMDLRMPLAGRYFETAAAQALAAAYEGTSAGTRYDAIPRKSEFLADCFPEASDGSLQTYLPESLEPAARAHALQLGEQVLHELERRYIGLLARKLDPLQRIFTGYRQLANAMDDELTADVDNVRDLIRDWQGDDGEALWTNFGDPLDKAVKNHRDIVRAIANAAEGLHAIQSKAIKHLDEITDLSLEAVYDVDSNKEVVYALVAIGAVASVAGAAATATAIAVDWAAAGAGASVIASLPLTQSYTVPASAADIDQMIEDLNGVLDEMETVMKAEQDSFAASLQEFIQSKRNIYIDGEQSTSSQIVPRAAQ
ncbi:hypothetical protein [Glycomyces dulcitolivorans]|uniref:hypothetical protein n=1 Tax=Glycomyces dulcitolivorans TaxID=2200759 RepID=UPI000DD3737D|nr:hypothetical protein [Glycomyces dulcitolivorans]